MKNSAIKILTLLNPKQKIMVMITGLEMINTTDVLVKQNSIINLKYQFGNLLRALKCKWRQTKKLHNCTGKLPFLINITSAFMLDTNIRLMKLSSGKQMEKTAIMVIANYYQVKAIPPQLLIAKNK